MQYNSPLCMCIISITKPTWSSCVSLPSSYNFNNQLDYCTPIMQMIVLSSVHCLTSSSLMHLENLCNLLKYIQWSFRKICKSFKHKHNTTIESIFTIKVPLFEHMTKRLCFCYFPNIESLWNKFKWKYWIIQIMIICMVVVIFHMHM
jgi:hypothetical protein